MSKYCFHLLAGREFIIDGEPIELPNFDAAVKHARCVALEVMKGAELSRRHWRISVCDGDDEVRGELLFASVDPTLAHLDPHLRATIEKACRAHAELLQTVNELDTAIMQSRALLSVPPRGPYLAAVGGRQVAPTAHAAPRSLPFSHPTRNRA